MGLILIFGCSRFQECIQMTLAARYTRCSCVLSAIVPVFICFSFLQKNQSNERSARTRRIVRVMVKIVKSVVGWERRGGGKAVEGVYLLVKASLLGFPTYNI